jgi:hypothetical protein
VHQVDERRQLQRFEARMIGQPRTTTPTPNTKNPPPEVEGFRE